MPLPSFAAPQHLDPTRQDSPQRVLWALSKMSTAIRGSTGRTWVDDDGELIAMSAAVADLLREVCVGATERFLDNPEGATARSESVEEFTASVTTDQAGYFNPTEREMLTQAVRLGYPDDGAFPGLGTISTTRGELETAPVGCDWGEGIDVEAGDTELIGWA